MAYNRREAIQAAKEEKKKMREKSGRQSSPGLRIQKPLWNSFNLQKGFLINIPFAIHF